ncbi:hypothetical protein DMC01_04065 [Campylobacter troglodytis]|nr:hypothetical protein DMC01_04065 [Campylobacter troglodytis]
MILEHHLFIKEILFAKKARLLILVKAKNSHFIVVNLQRKRRNSCVKYFFLQEIATLNLV